jgi:hypothetical protein
LKEKLELDKLKEDKRRDRGAALKKQIDDLHAVRMEKEQEKAQRL